LSDQNATLWCPTALTNTREHLSSSDNWRYCSDEDVVSSSSRRFAASSLDETLARSRNRRNSTEPHADRTSTVYFNLDCAQFDLALLASQTQAAIEAALGADTVYSITPSCGSITVVVVFKVDTDNTALQALVDAGNLHVDVDNTGSTISPTRTEVTPVPTPQPTPVPTPSPTPTPVKCNAGEFQTDTSVNDGSACAACPDGQYQAIPSHDTSCNQYDPCSAGLHRPSPAKDTRTACSACPSNTYKSDTGTWDSTCTAWTDCSAIQYETTTPDASTNRVCEEWRFCDTSTHYQTVVPTTTTNRQCGTLTVCSENVQYEFSAPAEVTVDQGLMYTSDRGCQGYSVTCTQDSTYETVARGPSNDRTCTSVTICTDEQWMQTPPTLVADTDCQPLTTCVYATHIVVASDVSTYDNRFSVSGGSTGVRTEDDTCADRPVCTACYQFEGSVTISNTACEPYVDEVTDVTLSWTFAQLGSFDLTAVAHDEWICSLGDYMKSLDDSNSLKVKYNALPAQGTQWNLELVIISDSCPTYTDTTSANEGKCDFDLDGTFTTPDANDIRWTVVFPVMFRQAADCAAPVTCPYVAP
jgi:hypothetical protein